MNQRLQPTSRVERLVADAVARFDALPEAEKQRRYIEFRRVYTIGEIMIANPELGRPYIEAAFDKIAA